MTRIPRLWSLGIALCLLATTYAGLAVAQTNYYTPPGPPGSEEARMRTLNELEPRTVIYSIPAAITNPGAYILVRDLTGVAASNGITISASDVSLDLNGFALVGVPSSGHGIDIPSNGERIAIRNGSIRNWGGSGIYGAFIASSRFESLQISSNGYPTSGYGLSIGQDGVISDCIVLYNKSGGFYLGDGCKVDNCTIRWNGGTGVWAGQNCIIRSCTAGGNSGTGFYLQKNGIISECNAANNSGQGFYASVNVALSHCTSSSNSYGFMANQGSVVSFCSAVENGIGFYINNGSVMHDCSAYRNSGDGIYSFATAIIRDSSSVENGGDGIDVANGSRVTGCLVRDQGGSLDCGIRAGMDCYIMNNTCIENYYGIFEGGGSVIAENIATDNTNGIYTASTAQSVLIRNVARGNLFSDYAIGSDTYGPMITAQGLITNQNPWANFDF